MIEEWYNYRIDEIDEIIKNSLEKTASLLHPISDEEKENNSDLINKLEENFNIQLSELSREIYIQGFKDSLNLFLEIQSKTNEKKIH